jgi:hypothetical protein
MHIKKNRKLTTQKIEDVDGANNRILNLFNVCVIQQNGRSKHHKVTPSRARIIIEKLLHSQVTNYKNAKSF